MNPAFLNKILKAIFKIFTKAKVVKKMPEQDNNTPQDQPQPTQKGVALSPNTQIVFTLKGFIATIMTILGLFIGFYKLAILPMMAKSEIYYQEALKEHKEHIDDNFDDLEEKVDRNADLIKDNHDRFRDLQNAIPNNSSGSFGSNNSTASTSTDGDSATTPSTP